MKSTTECEHLGPFKVFIDKVTLDDIVMVEGEKLVTAFTHGYKLGLIHKANSIKEALNIK